jgi:hypothetical protein
MRGASVAAGSSARASRASSSPAVAAVEVRTKSRRLISAIRAIAPQSSC